MRILALLLFAATAFAQTTVINGWGGSGGGATVTAAPPYVSVGGTKYLASSMYAVTLPSVAGWTNLTSGAGTIANGASGVIEYDVPGTTQTWAYSGVMSAFTQIDSVHTHQQYTVNNSASSGDWLGLYVYDSANSQIWGFTQHQGGFWDQLDVVEQSWSGSTASNPTTPNYFMVMMGMHYFQSSPGSVICRLKINAGAKTIQAYVSFDGGASFKLAFTSAVQTNTPSFTGILATACGGTLTVYSLATS